MEVTLGHKSRIPALNLEEGGKAAAGFEVGAAYNLKKGWHPFKHLLTSTEYQFGLVGAGLAWGPAKNSAQPFREPVGDVSPYVFVDPLFIYNLLKKGPKSPGYAGPSWSRRSVEDHPFIIMGLDVHYRKVREYRKILVD